MKFRRFISMSIVAGCMLGLAACSSTRGGNAPVTDANGGGPGGADGAYAQGADGGAGFGSTANCNVPHTSGFQTSSYYFDFNSNDIHPQDMSSIQSLAQSIATSHSSIRVTGNTDDRGSREYNMALGWRRANTVSSALQQYGVSKSQITTNSNGAEKPIAYGANEADYQCNRRDDVLYRTGG